jgi:hypothetical protein
MPTAELSRRQASAGLALVLSGSLGLRLWGIAQGLPYVYNIDEADHFVPKAVKMFDGSLNPGYFANPPAFTYVLHVVFDVWFGGGGGVFHASANHPRELYLLARVVAALLGTAAVWLLYFTGARLFGRGTGLLAATLEGVAFLPVFYGHLALNDAPTLAPLTLSLLGTAGVFRKGRAIDYLIAGVGLGLACATKYTAGIALLPLLAACLFRRLDVGRPNAREPSPAPAIARAPSSAPADAPPGPGRPAGGLDVVLGLALAGGCALLAFLIANPYSVLDFAAFHRELVHQSTLSAEAQGKLGAPREGGFLYYLWTLTWGLGWIPALAALAGAIAIWRTAGARIGWLLVPAPVLFLIFMGVQGRYFGRWLLPIFPILCLLAAHIALRAAAAVRARASGSGRLKGGRFPGARARRALALAPALAAVVLLCGQGAAYSIHSGLVLARTDTRQRTRDWMVANIPPGTRIAIEPVVLSDWEREPHAPAASRAPAASAPTSASASGDRWRIYPSLRSRIAPDGALEPEGATHVVGIEDYARTLAPALLGYYEREGYCWVITASTESGRAYADPAAVPLAIAYYRELAAQGQVVYRASPYGTGEGPVPFGFDWSFDYYPFAYSRPGPEMTVYRLRGGRCAA